MGEATSSPGRMAMKKDKEKTMERRGGKGDMHVSFHQNLNGTLPMDP